MNSVGSLLERAEVVLDRSALQRLRELDPDGRMGVVERVLRTYLQALANSMAAFDAAADDVEQLRRLAHTLKSSSASVGALRLAALCAEVETRVRVGDTADLGTVMSQLRSEGARVHLGLANILAPGLAAG
jgi:HPt (histidine-containing phosphotransfer) domain-containing protein